MTLINFIPKRYAEAVLEESKFSSCLLPAVRYLKTVERRKTPLIISGGVGCGKTYLGYAFLNDYMRRNNIALRSSGRRNYFINDFVLMTSLKSVINDLRSVYGGGVPNYDYRAIPFLIVDEVGLNYGTDSERIELFEVFNSRWEDMLPTMCLTNLKKPEIFKMLGRRIADRLFDNAFYIEMEEPSRRTRR